MNMPLCEICLNPKRKPRFDSCRITICQWCVTELTKQRTESPHSYITSLRNNFVASEERKISRLKNLAHSFLAPPVYPEVDIQNSTKWAFDIIRHQEGLLESVYRNLIDDKARLHEAETLAAKRRQDIITNHNAAVESYKQKLSEITKAREDYPLLEVSLPNRLNDYINEIFTSLGGSGQIKIPSHRLLRAYQKGLINEDNEILSRQDNESYENLRNFIKAQDGHACVICNKPGSKYELHVHHIIPLSIYGTNQHVNLVTLCLACHKKQHTAFDITANKSHKTHASGNHDNIFVAINVKTTGNLDTDDIVEISAARFENGVNKLRFHSYVYSDQYEPELLEGAASIPKQTILSAEKPSSVFEKLLSFIGEANLVFHDVNYALSSFRKHPNLYQSLSRRNVTDILKIAEKRKLMLKDSRLSTMLEYLRAQNSNLSFVSGNESINIGLAFIALSKTVAISIDKQPKEKLSNGYKEKLTVFTDFKTEETIDYAHRLYQQKNYTQAFNMYRKSAKQNDVTAMVILGNMYKNGLGVKNNDQHAVFCYQKAADHDYADGQFNLGEMYANGRGVDKDDQRAFFLYIKAAEQGQSDAQYSLGWKYANALGVEKNDQKAVFWYSKAAEQGHAGAQYSLGWRYANGDGLEKDDQKSVFWYNKAADQGNASAQNNLGWMYNNGRGVEKDDQKALLWYSKAAQQDNATAQYNLGVMYANGRGVEKDDRKAVLWYGKSAEQGYVTAQYYLGCRYAIGQGVEKDDQKAVFWYRKASAQGHADAQNKLKDFYQNQYADKSNEELISSYHEFLVFGDILEANVFHKMLFERSCSRLKNDIYSTDSIGNKHDINSPFKVADYKQIIDDYHEALAFGDLERSYTLYNELEKYQRHQFRNRVEANNMTYNGNVKLHDELIDQYHDAICFGDIDKAFKLFQSLIDSKLNEIINWV